MLGRFDEAREAYDRLRDAASEAHSEQYLLLAELGFAKIAIQRGNLPAAAGMLDRILVNARPGEHEAVRSKALMDRARVATQLGDLATAAVLGHQALESSTDPLDRDRILINIGMTLTHMGLREQARDAYLVAGATAQEAAVKWMAQINLMELAYLDGREVLFEQYRRGLADLKLPPYIEASYHETLAFGFCAFSRFEEATRAFESLLEVAERHGLNEFVIKAERALEDVSLTIPPLASTARADVGARREEIETVCEALSRMRVHAGL
jgi:tetratricopeptide (TPR) repeat protein